MDLYDFGRVLLVVGRGRHRRPGLLPCRLALCGLSIFRTQSSPFFPFLVRLDRGAGGHNRGVGRREAPTRQDTIQHCAAEDFPRESVRELAPTLILTIGLSRC